MIRIFITLLGISMTLVACQKELSSTKGIGNSVLDKLEKQQPPPQQFTVTAGSDSWVQGTQGTFINIPANAFVTASGQRVTGNVNIELKEIYSVADMVLNNKFTQSGLVPIESGGQFYIKASQNNQALKLAPGITLFAEMPTAAPLDNMMVFNGASYDTAGQSFFSWNVNANTASNNISSTLDSSGLYRYLMEFDALEWINCDRFINEPLFDARIKITNLQPGDQASVLVHFTGMKSIVQLYAKENYFTCKAPEREATLISVLDRNGQLYTAFKKVKLERAQTFELTLAPSTEPQFRQKLSDLQ